VNFLTDPQKERLTFRLADVLVHMDRRKTCIYGLELGLPT